MEKDFSAFLIDEGPPIGVFFSESIGVGVVTGRSAGSGKGAPSMAVPVILPYGVGRGSLSTENSSCYAFPMPKIRLARG